MTVEKEAVGVPICGVFAAPSRRIPASWLAGRRAVVLSSREQLESGLGAGSFDVIVAYLRAADAGVNLDLVRMVAASRALIAVLDVADRQTAIELLDEGADDVVTDATSPAELHARARAVARRRVGAAPGALSAARTPLASASVRGLQTHLRRAEFKLLVYLVEHAGRVVSQQELIEQVFGGAHAADTSLVRVHVTRLRSRLGERATALQTIKGHGYLLAIDQFVAALDHESARPHHR
jgi:DNA-binding response OmpR family regulator